MFDIFTKLFNNRQKRGEETPLAALLRAEIAARGMIGLDRFMELVLQHPDHGYYRQGDFLSGDGADFATAPEISQLFGEMVAVWLIDAWRRAGKPAAFALLELGPGRGTMMRDILNAAQGEADFVKAARLFLLESNATLRDLQRERLSAHAPTHIGGVGELPALPLLCVSNEFFDTQPLRQFVRSKTGWRERLIGCDGGGFVFSEGDETPLLPVEADVVIDSFIPGAYYEASDVARAYARQVAKHIAQHGGAALMIDYGYDLPRGKNSVIAVRARKFHEDIFALPGKADITADVDFSALAAIGRAAGLAVSGPIAQGDFLRLMGITDRAAALKKKASWRTRRKIDKDVHRLTDDREMGFAFRVLAYEAKRP
jgi:NADH dehydrogenase [ubiquinone] 1 alpha subcomplex assembly factor 7